MLWLGDRISWQDCLHCLARALHLESSVGSRRHDSPQRYRNSLNPKVSPLGSSNDERCKTHQNTDSSTIELLRVAIESTDVYIMSLENVLSLSFQSCCAPESHVMPCHRMSQLVTSCTVAICSCKKVDCVLSRSEPMVTAAISAFRFPICIWEFPF